MSQQINKSDRPILILCCLAILLCGYMLTDIQFFFGSNTKSDEISIGDISFVKSDVRHKSKNDYFWKDINLKSKISKGDSIFTGNNSSSEVTLKDGKLLKISQNSLVHFSTNKDQLLVDLAFGNISSSGLDKTMVITDCGQKYTIDANKANFEMSKTDKCGSFNIQVKTGAVKVNSKKVTKSIPKVKKISISDTFESVELTKVPKLQLLPAPSAIDVVAPIVEVPVAVVIPPPPVKTELAAPQILQKNRKVILSNDTKIKFSWNSVPDAKKYNLEISSNANFTDSNIIETTDSFYDLKNAQAGIYFLRLQATAPEFLNSPYSNIKIIKTELPPIVVDQLKIEDKYNARSPADVGSLKKFPVKWNPIPSASKYKVEVSDKTDLSNSIKKEVFSPEAFLEVPQTGNFYYRISALNKSGRQISSMPSIGEIVYKKINQISGPLISATSKKISYYFQKEYGQFVWLRWNPTQATSKYRLEISKDLEFKKINFAFATADTKYLIKSKIPEGEYFWRVRSENIESSQLPSGWSEIATLKIQTK